MLALLPPHTSGQFIEARVSDPAPQTRRRLAGLACCERAGNTAYRMIGRSAVFLFLFLFSTPIPDHATVPGRTDTIVLGRGRYCQACADIDSRAFHTIRLLFLGQPALRAVSS